MKKTCDDCEHFNYMGGCHDQPYPELWCGKGHWEGATSDDDIYKEIDCSDFEEKIRKII